MQTVSLLLIVVLVVGVTGFVNFRYRRYRATLTPEQRALDDEIVQDRLASW